MKPVCIGALALVEPERLFVQVAEQVERLDRDVRALDRRASASDQKFSSPFVWTLPVNVGFRVVDHVVRVVATVPL